MKKSQLLSASELALFFEQMAMIQRSGIPSIEGLVMMADDAPNENTRKLMNAICDSFCDSGSLYLALSASNVFPPYSLSMVHIGETSGTLDDVLASLAEYYEREDTIAREIRSAITYPLVMLAIMLSIVVILLVRVMPVFQKVYRQLGADMTGLSGTLLNIGSFLGKYGLLILFIVCAAGGLLFWLIRTRRLRLPFLQNFYRKLAAGHFASGMALTFSGGLNTDESLDMILQLVNDKEASEKIRKCRSMTADGMEFPEALAKCGLFSGLNARIVSVGYRVGSIDDIMKKVAARYQAEVQDTIQNLISIIEPSFVALLSLIVGVTLLSVILPLLGILSGMM